jgi:TPR repeat protein
MRADLLLFGLYLPALVFALHWAWLASRRNEGSKSVGVKARLLRASRWALSTSTIGVASIFVLHIEPTTLLRLRALLGNADAQFQMGERNLNGTPDDPKQDLVKAVFWLGRASQNGDPRAQHDLALLFQQGAGVPKDPVKAAYWYQKASNQGLIESTTNLATLYLNGEGVPRDKARAIELFQEAANRGATPAIRWLGESCWYGDYLPLDEGKAIHWFKQGANQADMTCIYFLGVANATGRGTAQDKEMANGCFKVSTPVIRQSAEEHGDISCQQILGEMYLHGYGLSADRDQGLFWLRKAAFQGSERAVKELKDLDQH